MRRSVLTSLGSRSLASGRGKRGVSAAAAPSATSAGVSSSAPLPVLLLLFLKTNFGRSAASSVDVVPSDVAATSVASSLLLLLKTEIASSASP